MKTRLAGAVLAAALLLPALARAEDVLVLSNGREARGWIVEEGESGVRLELDGGSMWYSRDRIREIRRSDRPRGAEPGAAAPAAADGARESFAVLYDQGLRVGTRVFRAAPEGDGHRFEEEVVFFGAEGRPELEVRTLERCDAAFRPRSFQVRETDGGDEHRSVSGEVRDGRLTLVAARNGERRRSEEALPEGARFPFAARELFLRESEGLGGRLSATVFDLRDERWRTVEYEEGGTRPVTHEGRVEDARVIVRRRGELVEREWVRADRTTLMAELNGEALRALLSSRDAVERLRQGDADRVTGPDSAARTTYADPELGWTIGKPDPSWTFERPAVEGGGALLSVRNEPLFASVDLLLDPAPPGRVTAERAAEALQRVCRAVAPDFRVLADGYSETEAQGRVYWMEAAATTKGEPTRTLARVVVRGDRVYRLLAACPEAAFAALRPDLERVLDSFRAE